MIKYIIVFDIPRDKKVLYVQVNRALKKINAEKIQHSVWESEDLSGLKHVLFMIKEKGGVAKILEKKIIV